MPDRDDPSLLTVEEAYRAVYRFITQYYARERITPLFLMLHSMAPAADGQPHDPATWPDWLESVEAARADTNLPYPEGALDGA